MSGGEKKKRASRAHGWEEAKDEFYQESYPTDTDFEGFERDPRKLATLLPSKQTRGATANRRIHQKETKGKNTMKKTMGRSNYGGIGTERRQSLAQDNYVAMMPDLSENLSNEETTWEEIMQIKSMPLNMTHKRDIKRNLQSKTKLRLQGYEQFQWQRRKAFQLMQAQWRETYTKLGLWQSSLKQIEGKFGIGVATYFQFIKWLMFLNMAIFTLLLCFIFLPTLSLEYLTDVANATSILPCTSNESVISCSANYSESFNSAPLEPLDIIQGTGWVGNTIMFFGKYQCAIFHIPDGPHFYNLPFAYVLVTLCTFVLSLIAIVKSAAQGFKDRLIEGEGQFYQYCNLVFGGWDFCIHNERAAVMKHKALYNEMKSHLMEEKLEEERKQRTKEARMKLFVVRIIVNMMVLAVLAGSGALIFYAFSYSQEWLKLKMTDFQRLLLEYLPSITIVLLNSIVPFLFRYLVWYERYSPMFVVRITLLRTVFLRLASIIVLLSSIYNIVSCTPKLDDQCSEDAECSRPLCWETYAGQQLYKLILLDFATHVLVTFFINFPRMLVSQHFDSRVARLIGEQQFELSTHVLDVVYSQTLCWLGTYYAPVLPALAAIELFLLFYIKKFACLINCRAPSSVYLASKSKSMFMLILLLSFAVAVTPVVVSIANIAPSAACGPFRGEQLVWNVVVSAFQTLPNGLQYIIFYFSTAGFAVPAFIVLAVALYYYYAVSQANKHMVMVLKNQLILEGHDKQFLLNRLSAFVKQQEQNRKQLRSGTESADVNSTTDNSRSSQD